MTKNYGKVGWNDGGSSNRFATLTNGDNEVRMVSSAYKYFTHKVKFDGDTNKYGRNIKCAVNGCPLCKRGEDVKTKYIAAVLMGNEIKLLDMGTLLYNKIKGIKTHMKGYDDPKDYFINIVRDPKGGAQNFYQAYPGEKVPFTAEQMVVIENDFDESELEEFCQPLSPDSVGESVEKIKAWIKRNGGAEAEAEAAPKKSRKVKDDDYEFTVDNA